MVNLCPSASSVDLSFSMNGAEGGALSKLSSFWKKAEQGRSGSVCFGMKPELF